MAVKALPTSVATICLHNPDVSIPAEEIARLAGELRSQPDPGACAPSIRVGNKVRTNGFHYPGVLRELVIAMRASSVSGAARQYGSGDDKERRVAGRGRRFGSGALIVIDRRAFESVGGFDERYFMYGEDLDLWHRISMSGHSTGFLPGVVAQHRSGSGSPATHGTRELLRWSGVELFAATHMDGAWRPMRRAHRLLLGRLAGVSPPLLETVWALWAGSATPEETSAAIRALYSRHSL
jgi:N-acetylglucosaminyl-diphospho-decaprenol L-rhamnosyltransferase